ncbi:MAG: excinuclease ABC subunit B, partial [Rhizobiales bacterium]|nr:excinuclease ABC subunit B [Hyphomicrobiales bacterium]
MAKRPTPQGFGEAPQAPFEGEPLSGNIADWIDEIARAADAEPIAPKPKRAPRARGERMQLVDLPVDAEKKARKRDDKGHKSGRGTSIGIAGSAKERAASGLMPVAGLDVTLEEAEAVGSLASSSVTATVAALTELIEKGRPEIRDKSWVPHRPPRPEKSEGGVPLRIVSDFEPRGDQPQAIAELVGAIRNQERDQVLLGVTGSGKTFTM